MSQRIRFTNVLILVAAFFLPLFATITTTATLLLFHFFLLGLLTCSTYVSINQIMHPRLKAWLANPTKPRDFIFTALIDFIKIEVILVPCVYVLLKAIGYEEDERNQASLVQIILTLSHYAWCYWLITKSVCAYTKARHNQ
jgi:hypothetical protein